MVADAPAPLPASRRMYRTDDSTGIGPTSSAPSTVTESPESPTGALAMQPLPPLPHRVNLVTKNPDWLDVIEGRSRASLAELYARCESANEIWSAQLYLDLKQAGLDARLVARPVPDEINILPYPYIHGGDWLFKSFVIAVRCDEPVPGLCDYAVVINELQARRPRTAFVMHRPMPMIRPRDPARGSTIRNLVFKGYACNLPPVLRDPAFTAALTAQGLEFKAAVEGKPNTFDEWADYREADLVIALRNLTTYDASLKPPLKLLNGWHAGVPSLLGPEPAYQAMRTSELDYIEVRDSKDVIDAIRRLKADPDLYLRMIAHGRRRAAEIGPEYTVRHWHALLSGPIAESFAQWRERPLLVRRVVEGARYPFKLLTHKVERRLHLRRIYHGRRLLEA